MAENRQILETEVTIDVIQQLIQNRLRTNRRIRDWKVDEICGNGLMSKMAKIELVWEDSKEAENVEIPKNIVAKIPTTTKIGSLVMEGDDFMAEIIEKIKAQLHNIHNCEVSFYDMFSALTEVPVKLAKYYGAFRMTDGGPPAVLLLEDLSSTAQHSDLVKALSADQLYQVAEQIARLQAWSLTNDQWRQCDMNLDLMKEIDEDERMEGEAVKSYEKFLELVKGEEWKAKIGPELAAKVPELKLKPGELIQAHSLHLKLGIPDVLVHGDFWNNNFMFNKSDGKLAAILDWQVGLPGSPAEDFLKLFTTSVAAQVRRDHGEQVFRQYYQVLGENLGKTPPFTFEQFWNAFHELLRIHISVTVPRLPDLLAKIRDGTLGIEMDTKGVEERILDDTKAFMEDVLAWKKTYHGPDFQQ